MADTLKRTSISLCKEDVKQLERLCKHFGESSTGVIRRAIIMLHHITIKNEDKKNERDEQSR